LPPIPTPSAFHFGGAVAQALNGGTLRRAAPPTAFAVRTHSTVVELGALLPRCGSKPGTVMRSVLLMLPFSLSAGALGRVTRIAAVKSRLSTEARVFSEILPMTLWWIQKPAGDVCR